MLRILVFASFAFLSVASLSVRAGEPSNEVVSAVSTEMHAFSVGDRSGFVSSFVTHPSILDDSAPFVWRDAGAWYDKNRPQFKDVTLTPATPSEVQISENDRAFICVPFRIDGHGLDGTPFHANGYWTGILLRSRHRWGIANVAITIVS